VVQAAVLIVTLFLKAISEMADKTKKSRNERPGPRRNQTILSQRLDDEEEMPTQTVGILGYADNWVLYKGTKNHQMPRPKIICKQYSKEWHNSLRQMASESLRKKQRPCIYAVYIQNRRTIQILQHA
jgi:hypothetical protein